MHLEGVNASGSDGAELVDETLFLGPASEIDLQFEIQFDDIIGSDIDCPTERNSPVKDVVLEGHEEHGCRIYDILDPIFLALPLDLSMVDVADLMDVEILVVDVNFHGLVAFEADFYIELTLSSYEFFFGLFLFEFVRHFFQIKFKLI